MKQKMEMDEIEREKIKETGEKGIRKVVAMQVDPQVQQSPLLLFDAVSFGASFAIYDDEGIYSRSEVVDCTSSVFQRVVEAIQNKELGGFIDDINNGVKDFYDTKEEAIEELLPKERGKYSKEEIEVIAEKFLEYGEVGFPCDASELTKLLSLVDGREWNSKLIQSFDRKERYYMFYPVDSWNEKNLEIFKVEYLNEGTEWDLSYYENGVCVNDENLGNIYIHTHDDDEVKREIATLIGEDVENIELYKFAGYRYIPQYYAV